jgi:hypothetical protein
MILKSFAATIQDVWIESRDERSIESTAASAFDR